MPPDEKRDGELGLDRSIPRRDFVRGTSAILGSTLAACGTESGSTGGGDGAGFSFDVGEAWYGPGGVGDYAPSHGNTPEVVSLAHRVRAGEFDNLDDSQVTDSDEAYDLVIVGGGIAGLSAAHHFRRLNPSGRCLVLDNHPIFGGEAKRNELEVRGTRLYGPQGSNDFGVPPVTGDPDDYFTALDIARDFAYAEATGVHSDLRIPPDNYGFLHWQEQMFSVGHHFGGGTGWVHDMWRSGLAAVPWTPETRGAVARWRATDVDRVFEERGAGAPEIGPWLDGMTMKAYYEEVLGLPPEFTRYVDPILASIIGLGCDALSAWWGHHFELPGFRAPDRYAGITFHSFPGGNAGLARYFVRSLVPGALGTGDSLEDVVTGRVAFDALDRDTNNVRLRLGATVVRVAHEGSVAASERVQIFYARGDRVHRVRGRSVVMASGGWINRRVLRDLPATHHQAYRSFSHSSVLVVNVALDNWQFLDRLGVAAAMWLDGFGFACNIRRPMQIGPTTPPLHPDQPVMMTWYVPLFSPGLPREAQGIEGRRQVLTTSFADYERQLREQMTEMFAGAGFDARRDIAGIVLNRWGHAYVNPGTGFMFGRDGADAPPDVIRQRFGRIAIGHSELRGHQNWTGAAGEGRRAAEALEGFWT